MKFARVLAAAVITFLVGAAPHAVPQQPPAGAPPTTVHRFAAPLRAGFAPIVEAPDGTLFGVMEGGGVGDYGAVFQLAPNGSGGFVFSILYQFHNEDGAAPRGLTYYAPDDLLYGVTARGGVTPGSGLVDGFGTIFTLNRSGVLTTLHDLDQSGVPQPLVPQAPLLLASDGNFYGVAGGASGAFSAGSVFKLSPAGQLDLLHSFSGADGSNPAAQLVEGSDGSLYGTTTTGGANDDGTVFKIGKDGNGFSTLHSFAGGAPGNTQPRGLMLDTSTGSDLFYGVTAGGGSDGRGAIFEISPAGAFHLRASFPVTFGFALKGSSPNGALVRGSDGLFYGTTEGEGPIPFASAGTVFSFDPALNAIEVVHDYNNDFAAGVATSAGLLVAANGTLLGTTTRGGAHRVGTVYRVDLTTSPQTVSKVVDVPSLGPSGPEHRLLRASNGLLYGTTIAGGAFNSGTIFRVDSGGRVTTLHDFNFIDGHQPSGELVEGSDGYLYGTTTYGGNVQFQGDFGGGTVYRIAKSGADFSIVHRFTDYAVEGASPLAGLVEGPDGNFYGTTHQNGPGGAGTVFKMTPAGAITTLHGFSVWSATRATLVLGPDGYFYGVTREGGTNPNGGTIYKINSSGDFVLLHEFVDPADGAHPNGLALGTDGNFYGTTEHGGTFFGTLFRITPAGTFTVLHRFDREVDGSDPMSAPFEAGDGRLYGTAWFGGTIAPFVSGGGTLYSYDSTGFQPLYTFGTSPTDTGGPIAGVTQGNDNLLYGLNVYPEGGGLYAWDRVITNKAPVVPHARLSVGAGSGGIVTFAASDPDGDPLTFTLLAQPANGSVLGSGGGAAFQYLANPGFTGTDFFYVRASDGFVSSAVAGVMVTVGASNTAPVAYDGSVTTTEDAAVTASLTTFDDDGNPLTFTVVTPPAHGTLSGSAPDFIYTPAADYNGSDSFTFKVNDGTADSNIATFSITVDPVNDAPVALAQSVTSNGLPVGVVLSATDIENDPLSYQVVDDPQHGTLSGSAPNLTYTPTAGFVGTDTFTFYAYDGGSASNVATITIVVRASNRAPAAQDGSVIVRHDRPTSITLAATDPDADALSFINVTLPAHGALSGTAPTYTYTPHPDYTGADSFTFKVNDGTSDSNVATVSITVRPLDRAPIANPGGPYTTDFGAPVTFDGSASSDPDEIYGDSIVEYHWTVGPIHLAFGPKPTISGSDVVSILGAGYSSITLRVTDSTGFSTSANAPLMVRRPTADFTISPNPAACGVAMTFDATAAATARSTRTIVSYVYDFGDGTGASTGVVTQHTYARYTNYAAQLTVTDDLGITATRTQPVSIHPGHPPVANAGGPYAARIGSGIAFDGRGSSDPNTACGDSIISYQWLVNGTIALGGATPSLTAAQVAALGPGTFPVQLTVLDTRSGGDTASTTLTIQPLTIGTTTTLTASATTLGALQPLTLTAAVIPANGSTVTSGTVTFYVNGTTIAGTAPLVNGVATLHTNAGTAAGITQVTAQFPGDASYSASTSAPVAITTVAPVSSSFTLVLPWTNPRALGLPVTVSAYVLPLGTAPTPTGTVEFYDNGVLVTSAALSGGLATIAFTPAGAGTHVLSARYLGNATLAPSTAPPAFITIFSGVTPASSTASLSVTPNPVSLGQPVTFTATVTAGSTPTGTVTFFVNGQPAGTAAVVAVAGSLQAMLTMTSLPLGAHVVSASYGGSAGFAASNSNLALLVVR